LDNRPGSGADEDLELDSPGQAKLRFPSKDLAAKHKVAQAAAQSFDAVFDYARAVTVFCQASLVDTSCTSCEDGEVRYKPRSDLNPHYWPVIEDALSMLDGLMNVQGLDSAQTEQLVVTKGRLLWLAGRSTEEESLIDSYARAHPDAVAIVKRRLELLHDSGDATGVEAQCARSRARMKSAPEAARLELLTSCVALHPGNRGGRTDPPDYTTYLPNLATEELGIYRTHLVQRCVADLGDNESRCAEACACVAQASDKPPSATCKRTCRDCRVEAEQQIHACNRLGTPEPESVSAPARSRSPRPKGTGNAAPRPKSAPASRPKDVDSGSEPQQAVL